MLERRSADYLLQLVQGSFRVDTDTSNETRTRRLRTGARLLYLQPVETPLVYYVRKKEDPAPVQCQTTS